MSSTPQPVAPASSLELVGVRAPADLPGIMEQALKAVAAVPEGKNGALVAFAEIGPDGQPKASLAVMGRGRDGWSWIMRADWADHEPSLSATLVKVF